jgi:hypothetical protein
VGEQSDVEVVAVGKEAVLNADVVVAVDVADVKAVGDNRVGD